MKQNLCIKVIEATTLLAGYKILINPAGMVGGLRKARDGITYFGTDQSAGETVFKSQNNIGTRSRQ